MPRRPRDYQPGSSFHVIQRGNNRQRCFFGIRDFVRYRAYLHEASREHGCAIHAYVLMTNHVHLLVTPKDTAGISQMMQSLGRRYVQYVNRRLGRTGTLWEGRHKSSLVDSDPYWYVCARYIELNPVRAGMVSSPSDYRWSSHHGNASGEVDPLLEPHILYLALGEDQARRRQAYGEMFADSVAPADLSRIRRAANQGISISRMADQEIQAITATTPTPITGRR